MARLAPSAGEGPNPPGRQRHRRSGGSTARQTLLHAPSVIRPNARIAATRHAKGAVRLRQAPPPICKRSGHPSLIISGEDKANMLRSAAESVHQAAVTTISESLADLDVLVVDCQATGAAPRGHLLEIGWARAGTTITRADARLIALPEGEHISPAVMRLTGITEKMSQGGVDANAAWRELSDEVAALPRQPAPTVIHFARFEQPFLSALAGGAIPIDIVCTPEFYGRLLLWLSRCD